MEERVSFSPENTWQFQRKIGIFFFVFKLARCELLLIRETATQKMRRESFESRFMDRLNRVARPLILIFLSCCRYRTMIIQRR